MGQWVQRYGVQRYGEHGQWDTWAMGYRGNAVWGMGYRGMGHTRSMHY